MSSDIFPNGLDHSDMVFATDHVLPFVFQFYVKALAPVGVVAEILTYDDVAEISPVAEKSAASAESDTCGRGITCVDLHDVGKGECFVARKQTMDYEFTWIDTDTYGAVVKACRDDGYG